MNAIATVDFNTLISLHNNQAVTTSQQVAETFGKRHDDVLRKIDQLKAQVVDSFYIRNFAELEIEQKSNLGNGTYKTRAFELTKDGFVLLVMGFTGKAAMAIKIAYIEAFNFMAAQLSGSPKPENKTTADQRTGLRDAVNALVSKRGLIYPEAYNMVHQRFNVAHIDELSTEQLPQAVAYVHALTISNVLHGEVLDAEPKLPKPQGYVLTDRDIAHLSTLTRYAFQMSDLFGAMTEGLHLIKSQYTAQAYSWSNEPNSFIGHAQEILMEARCFMKEPLAIDIYKRNFSKMILI